MALDETSYFIGFVLQCLLEIIHDHFTLLVDASYWIIGLVGHFKILGLLAELDE